MWLGNLYSGATSREHQIKKSHEPDDALSLSRLPPEPSGDCDSRSEVCSTRASTCDDFEAAVETIPPTVAELVEISKQARLKRGNRIVIRAVMPRKWTEISAVASAASCVTAFWWRGCDNQCRVTHRRRKTMCSVVVLGFEDATKTSIDGSLIPLRFVVEAYVLPHDVTVPCVDTAFWSYNRAHASIEVSSSSPNPDREPPKAAPVKVVSKPTTCVPLFDKILATGQFDVEGGLATGVFIYLQVPAEVGILTYLRKRQRSIDWMLMWRGCCEDCRADGKFFHPTNLTCYLLFLGLHRLVLADVFVPQTFIEWVRNQYIVASFAVQPDPDWQNWTEGLYLQKKSGEGVKQAQVDTGLRNNE